MGKSIKKVLLGSVMVLMLIMLAACGNSNVSKPTQKTTTSKKEQVQSKKASRSSVMGTSESSLFSDNRSLESSSMSSASSSRVAVKNLTPQQMGIILAMDQEPEVISDYLGNALWYGVVDNSNGGDDEIKGYNYISTHGDGTADIYWKVNGDVVTFKQLDPNSGDCVADEKLMTKTIPVSQLIQKYYSTPQQQNQVNNDANQLKQGN